MIYPNRKKLTEYPIVTPTLADSVVNIQGSTVKRSTLQSILDLFDANATQASSFVKGVAQLANQTEAELAASGTIGSIDDTKIITPTGWRYAWNKALTLAWTFASKIAFRAAINVGTTSGNPPSVTEQGDIYYSNAGLLGAGYYGVVEGVIGDAKLIATNNTSSESALGIIQIATQAEVDAGAIDTKSITPLKLKNKTLNTSNVASGGTSATLNAINGIISYANGANASMLSYYTLTNSKISSSSYINACVKLNPADPAVLLLGGYSITGTTVSFYIYNAGSISGAFKIHFQVVG